MLYITGIVLHFRHYGTENNADPGQTEQVSLFHGTRDLCQISSRSVVIWEMSTGKIFSTFQQWAWPSILAVCCMNVFIVCNYF